ncbi:hypothetical protein B0H19DRAFT_1103565 [Mycena capillaripes]|nr:hypothetical protein B0H19DRAFT_1103565 [Mycena capillaripes]
MTPMSWRAYVNLLLPLALRLLFQAQSILIERRSGRMRTWMMPPNMVTPLFMATSPYQQMHLLQFAGVSKRSPFRRG